MKNILVTAIGSWSAIAVINSLKDLKYRIIGCDINSKDYLYSSFLVDSFYKVPFATDPEYINTLITICINEKINCVIVLTDPEIDIISEFRSQFKDVILCIPNTLSIKRTRDKKLLYDFFYEDKLIKVIPTYSLNNIDISAIGFPLLLKPKNGRSSEGILKIENSHDLKYAQSNPKFSKHIAQPFMSGSIYTVDVIRNSKSKKIIAIPRCEIIRSTNGAGISIKICNDTILINISKIIAEKLSIIGCINIEFIKHKEVYYLMDVNPRFSAGIAFSILTGYNIVKNHLSCFYEKEIDCINNFDELIITKTTNEIILD
jgi:carbamoyl-phosphate synthase large subunit